MSQGGAGRKDTAGTLEIAAAQRKAEMPAAGDAAEKWRPLRTLADLQGFLQARGMFHMDLRLTRMEEALQALGITALPCPVIHVVGTNGKGSTSAFLHGMALAHGKTSALFTSPHFLDVTERLRIENPSGNSLIQTEELPAWAEKALCAVPDLTYFELVTVVAAQAIAEKKPDIAVIEAGLGAWHDATSALFSPHGIFVCFTPIDMDHAATLGPTLEDIAKDKAYAMRKGVQVAVSAKQVASVQAILLAQAKAMGVPLFFSGYAQVDTANWRLKGIFQKENAANALCMWQQLCTALHWQTTVVKQNSGMQKAFIPGRFQFAGPYILDGGHNPHGVKALMLAMQAENIRPKALVFTCMADKDMEGMVQLLGSMAALPFVPVSLPVYLPVYLPVLADNHRAAKPEDLVALLAPLGFLCCPMPSVASALQEARTCGEPVLVCGSLYLLAEFFTLFPQYLLPQ